MFLQYQYKVETNNMYIGVCWGINMELWINIIWTSVTHHTHNRFMLNSWVIFPLQILVDLLGLPNIHELMNGIFAELVTDIFPFQSTQ